MISVSVHHLAVCLSDLHYLLPLMGLPVLLLSTLGFILPREKLSHIVSPGDPATSGLLKINKTAFSSITVLVGLIISSRPGGTLCTPHAPSSVGITFCTYLAGVHGPLMHPPWEAHQFSHSVVSDFVTPWTEARHGQASLSITNSRSFPNSCPLSH